MDINEAIAALRDALKEINADMPQTKGAPLGEYARRLGYASDSLKQVLAALDANEEQS